MNARDLHDVKNLLRRLEIMAELLARGEYDQFGPEEIRKDAAADLERLRELFAGGIQ